MGSVAIPGFIENGSGIKKLIGGYTTHKPRWRSHTKQQQKLQELYFYPRKGQIRNTKIREELSMFNLIKF
jgi:hypothetical protein